MGRPRTRLPWRYDDSTQQFETPAGIITLKELAELRYGLASSHIDLQGPWAGWHIRGALLKSRFGTLRPETAAQFIRWVNEEMRQNVTRIDRQTSTGSHLRLVYSRRAR